MRVAVFAAKDVDAVEVIYVIALLEAESNIGVSRWSLNEVFPEVPEKVMLAKLRRLIRSGKIDGCVCGCRGDFTLVT